MNTNELDQAANGQPARREVLKAMALTAGVAAAGMAMQSTAHAITPALRYKDIPEPGYLNLPWLPAGNDIKVLNYALALEDLESDLYVQALQRLTGGGTNKLGRQIPGLGLGAGEPDVFFINQFAAVEAEHRDFLRSSLESIIHGIAIKPFKYDFGIETKSRAEVLALVLLAEQTGVSAYLGAVPKLKTRAFITGAAAIQGTEARHTAVLTAVQNVLFNGSSPKPVAPLASDNHGIETPTDPDTVLASVSPFIVKA